MKNTKVVFYESGYVQLAVLDSNHTFYDQNKKAFHYKKGDHVFFTEKGFIH